MKPTVAPFPATRLRRMRQSPALRALARQNTLTVDDLIWPIFVMEGKDDETPVSSMPGVVRRTVDRVGKAAKEAQDFGIPAICVFPYTGMEARTEDCAMAWDTDNIANRAIREIKAAAPDIAVMTDGNPASPSRSIAAMIDSPPIDATGSASSRRRYSNTSSTNSSADGWNEVEDARDRSDSPSPALNRAIHFDSQRRDLPTAAAAAVTVIPSSVTSRMASVRRASSDSNPSTKPSRIDRENHPE